MDAAGPSRRMTRAAARRQREPEDIEMARTRDERQPDPLVLSTMLPHTALTTVRSPKPKPKPKRSPFLKRSRPAWEPAAHHKPEEIKANPWAADEALRSLQRQGCQDPVQHYLPEHECKVHQRRLECLRQVAIWNRNRYTVEQIATRLPNELAIQVFEYVVLSSQSHLAFQDEYTLATTAREIIGTSTSAEALVPLATESLLKQSIFDINVEYRRTDRQRVVVLLPDLSRVPNPLRRARLTLNFEISEGRQNYPALLYVAAAGIPSFISQLPGLQDLHFLLRINLTKALRTHQGSPLAVQCRKGFSGISTLRAGVEDLVAWAKTARPSLEVHVELQYNFGSQWQGAFQAPKTYNVAQSDMTVEQLVEAADAKWQG